ncbi:MAG TPA: BBP7 family outer membrane beta-barrel protein [Gemmataceae bacterium]|jgi:hypothetical protein|nr:BBP7 family outer membrane beta-barrel protein [Gemmataceae bacterium]
MGRKWATSWSVLFLLFGSAAQAQDVYAPPRNGNAPAATLGRPVPAATMGRPIAVDPRDGGPNLPLQPAEYENNGVVPSLRPIPTGPNSSNVAPPLAPLQGPMILDSEGSVPSTPGVVIPNPEPMPPTTNPAPIPAGPRAQPQGMYPQAPCPNCGGSQALIAAPCGNDMTCAPACNVLCCPCGDPLGPWWNRFYGSAEFLMWWVSNTTSPPLLATAPTRPTNVAPIPPGTTLLFDGSSLYPTNRYGTRLTLGWWIDPCGMNAIEASAFFLGTAYLNQNFDAANFGGVLFRPFHVVNSGAANGGNFSENVNEPGGAGSVAITGYSSLWGAEVDYRRKLCCCGCSHLDFLFGFRYLNLNEQLQISESFGNPNLPLGPGNSVIGTLTDRFTTRNDFYGLQIGVSGERCFGRWTIDGTAKVAYGYTDQSVTIFGQQVVTAALPPQPTGTFNGGLLALPSNIGTWHTSTFSVVPEVDLNIGFYLTPRVKLFVGYTSLIWTGVMRPGDQIDTNVDATRIPNFNGTQANGTPFVPTNAPNPVVPFRRTDLWVNGINVGLQLKW